MVIRRKVQAIGSIKRQDPRQAADLKQKGIPMTDATAPAKKTRERFIDYGKAIIIFAVAINHVGAPFWNDPSVYMLFFFFVAGYVHNGRRPIGDAIKRRFKAILVPFWIAVAVIGLLEIPRAYYLGYGDWRIFLVAITFGIYGSGRAPYLGPVSDYINSVKGFHPDGVEGITDAILPMISHLWFLPAMFLASVMFYVYAKKLRRGVKTDVIAIVILCILAWTETLIEPQFPYGFGRACWGCTAMIAGLMAKERPIFSNLKKGALLFIASVILAGAGYFLGDSGVAPVISLYGPYGLASVFISVIAGIAGCDVFCFLLKLLERVFRRDEWLCVIGRNTMPLYLWHMPVINALSIGALALLGTAPSPDFVLVTLLPDEMYPLKYVIAAAGLLLVLLVEKKLGRAR